jgi:hypothetical protein
MENHPGSDRLRHSTACRMRYYLVSESNPGGVDFRKTIWDTSDKQYQSNVCGVVWVAVLCCLRLSSSTMGWTENTCKEMSRILKQPFCVKFVLITFAHSILSTILLFTSDIWTSAVIILFSLSLRWTLSPYWQPLVGGQFGLSSRHTPFPHDRMGRSVDSFSFRVDETSLHQLGKDMAEMHTMWHYVKSNFKPR